MGVQKAIKVRVNFIRGLHKRLGLDNLIELGETSEPVASRFGDKHVRRGLERAIKELRSDVHKIKVNILTALLSQVEQYGFLDGSCDYVDWCSGRGELSYAITHLFGGSTVRVDRKFSKTNILENYFPCTQHYQVPTVVFDLTTLREKVNAPPIVIGQNKKIAYVGSHCCGSLPDLIVQYGELQREKPDFVAIIPCHHEKMDFELSTLASKIAINKDIFKLLTRAVADLHGTDGYHDAARKAMEIIDHHRALNLRHLGYDSKVVRLYHPNVSSYNHLIIGVRR